MTDFLSFANIMREYHNICVSYIYTKDKENNMEEKEKQNVEQNVAKKEKSEKNEKKECKAKSFILDHLPALIAMCLFVFLIVARICYISQAYTASAWLNAIGTVCVYVGLCWKLLLMLQNKKFVFDVDLFAILVCLVVIVF